MDWCMVLGLLSGCDPRLHQQTHLRNGTAEPHPFMFWSNCAVPADPATEFLYPPGPALSHSDALRDIAAWGGSLFGTNPGPLAPGVRQDSFDCMTGVFWKAGQGDRFG